MASDTARNTMHTCQNLQGQYWARAVIAKALTPRPTVLSHEQSLVHQSTKVTRQNMYAKVFAGKGENKLQNLVWPARGGAWDTVISLDRHAKNQLHLKTTFDIYHHYICNLIVCWGGSLRIFRPPASAPGFSLTHAWQHCYMSSVTSPVLYNKGKQVIICGLGSLPSRPAHNKSSSHMSDVRN